jgi:hypothetical protein
MGTIIEWVVHALKPSPQITLNTVDIAECHTQVVIQFPPRRSVSSKSSYPASHTTIHECSHTPIFNGHPFHDSSNALYVFLLSLTSSLRAANVVKYF